MAAPNDLTTLDNALAWLDMQNDVGPGVIARLITACSTQIQSYIGRTIVQQTYTGTFNGRGSRSLLMPNYPITAVSSVQVWTASIPARVLGSVPGYTFDDKTVFLDHPYYFERGAQNVTIAYTAGYATIPLDIEQACIDAVNDVWASKEFAASVENAKAGDHQLAFNSIAKMSKTSSLIPAQILARLQPYVRVYPA
jgi:hypothetical protein